MEAMAAGEEVVRRVVVVMEVGSVAEMVEGSGAEANGLDLGAVGLVAEVTVGGEEGGGVGRGVLGGDGGTCGG